MWVIIAALGLVVTVWLGRAVSDDRWVQRIVIASYVVVVAATVALFFTSLWRLPILPSMQAGDGFWYFAPDAVSYHRRSLVLLEAWRLNTVPPMMGFERAIVVYVAVIHRLFGESPLNVSVLNAWYGTLTVLGAVWLARRYGARPLSVRATALLVGFWPSGLLWSTQILKESITTAILVGVIVSLVAAARTRRPATACIAALSIAGLVFLLWFSRYYAAGALMAAIVVVVVPWAIALVFRGEGRRAGLAIAGVLLVLAGLGLASAIPVSDWPQFPYWGALAEGRELSQSAVARAPLEVSDPVTTLARRVRALPAYLGVIRDGGMIQPGRSVLDPDVTIASWGDLLRYLPRGLVVEFLVPFPWQWFAPGRPPAYALAGVENLLIYALLPCLVVAVYRLFKSYDPALTVAALTIAMLAVGYAISIPSVGTIFRLRFQVIVLALAVMGSADAYATMYGRLFGVTSSSPQAVPEC